MDRREALARYAASAPLGDPQIGGFDASAPLDQQFMAVPVAYYRDQFGQLYYATYGNPGLQMQTYVPVAMPSHGMTSVAYVPNGMVMQNGMPFGHQQQNLPSGYQGEENEWFQQ
jgi:hypothetical protein